MNVLAHWVARQGGHTLFIEATDEQMERYRRAAWRVDGPFVRADLHRGAVSNPLDDPQAMARATEALQVSANMPHGERARYIVAVALGEQ